MARRARVTVTFEADESKVSSDRYEAQDELEAAARQFAAEFGPVKSISISLTGWPNPGYDRLD